MARRIMLNGTSYFGQGAIQEIVNEIKNRHKGSCYVYT